MVLILDKGYETGYEIKDGFVLVPIDEFQSACVVVTAFCNIIKAHTQWDCWKSTKITGMIASSLSRDFKGDCENICNNFKSDLYDTGD